MSCHGGAVSCRKRQLSANCIFFKGAFWTARPFVRRIFSRTSRLPMDKQPFISLDSSVFLSLWNGGSDLSSDSKFNRSSLLPLSFRKVFINGTLEDDLNDQQVAVLFNCAIRGDLLNAFRDDSSPVKELLRKNWRRGWGVLPPLKGQCTAAGARAAYVTVIMEHGASIKRQSSQYVTNLETFHSLQNHRRAQATEIDHADLFPRLQTEPPVLFARSLFSPEAAADAVIPVILLAPSLQAQFKCWNVHLSHIKHDFFLQLKLFFCLRTSCHTLHIQNAFRITKRNNKT